MQSVYAEGDLSLIGAMAAVEIIGVGPNSLIGRLVAPASREMGLIDRFAGRPPI
jgi:hypothetical protein